MKSFYSLDMLENKVFGDEPEDEWGAWPEEEIEFQVSEELSEEFKETEPIFLTVTLDGGIEAECRVAGVFLEGEKEYIALEMPDGGIDIMGLEPGEEDGIRLIPVEDEEEQQRAIGQFIMLFHREIPEEGMNGEALGGESIGENQGTAAGQDSAEGQDLKTDAGGRGDFS